MALTGKKKAFADAVFSGKSNKEAAILAGYSKATAGPAGSRLVKDKEVTAYLSKCKAAAESGEAPSADAGAGLAAHHDDPKTFLMAAMNDKTLDERRRIDAAKALMPFVHVKLGEGGKKDDADKKAKEAAAGKFAPSVAPKLAAAHGKRV